MDPLLLHSVVTNCTIECLRLLQSVNDPEDLDTIRALADCAATCTECAQGCQSGTCLPETLDRCRASCDAAIRIVEQQADRLDVRNTTQQILFDCSEACGQQ